MPRKVTELGQLDAIALRQIDSHLRPIDRIMLSLCSKDFTHFTRSINVSKCNVSIDEESAEVTLCDEAGKRVIRFMFDVENRIQFGTDGAKKENIFHLKAENGQFASVQFGRIRYGGQQVRAAELFRDIPRFVSHLHSLFQWTKPTEYNFHRELMTELKQLYTHIDLPFSIKVQTPKYGCKEEDERRKWKNFEDFDGVPNTCQSAERTNVDSSLGVFLYNWLSGNAHCPDFKNIRIKTDEDWLETFQGILGLAIKTKKKFNRFCLYSKEQPEEKRMMTVTKVTRAVEIKVSAGCDRIIGILKMMKRQRELKENSKLSRSTRKRAADGTLTREGVEKELEEIRKWLKEAGVYVCKEIRTINED